MEKQTILSETKKITSIEDLARLLNKIKQDEFSTERYPITSKQLLHFCNSKIVPNRYKVFYIRKKNGGLREINAPCYQLSIILHVLNILLKSVYTPSDSAMGFTEGRSILTNASMHVGHNYVLNLDLKDFFPSIPQARVWKRLQLPPFNFTQEIANVVAGLCCHKNKEKGISVLPQGAATSPILTNAICDKLDRRLKGVANRFGLHYSRYADDMTFSGMRNKFRDDDDFMQEVKRIVSEQGFVLNDAKKRVLKKDVRQEVTGLTVNSIVNVSRKYIKDLRFLLNIWERYGYSKAYACFYPRYKKEKGYIKKGEPVMENVIEGKLNYLKMIRGVNNPSYLKLVHRYNNLQQMVYVDSETDKGTNYIYVQPYTLIEFEKEFNTKISLEISPKCKVVGKCTIYGMDKTLPISVTTQKMLCPNAESLIPGSEVTSDKLKEAFVTLCRHKGKNFWLITLFEPKRSKCMSLQTAKMDVDLLLDCWEKKGLEKAVELFNCIIEESITPDELSNLKDSLEEKSKDKSNQSLDFIEDSISSPKKVMGFQSLFGDEIKNEKELCKIIDNANGLWKEMDDGVLGKDVDLF